LSNFFALYLFLIAQIIVMFLTQQFPEAIRTSVIA
jgi:hypothetical protein